MTSYTNMEEGYGQFIVLDHNLDNYFNEHNEQNDIEKNIKNPSYYNTSFCVDSSQIKNYNKIVNNRFINNQHFVLYCAMQGLNMVQNVYNSIFG